MFGKWIIAGTVTFLALQLVRPAIPETPAPSELQTNHDIRRILDKSCYSCHSDERRLSWFDEIVPAYWLVRHDILTARERLNFSNLGSRPAPVQKAALYEAVNMMQLGAMPLPNFVKLHPEAKVTPEDIASLKAYLNPWKPVAATETSAVPSPSPMSAPLNLAEVQPERNGLAFDPAFATWKLISTTDRGDNQTLRFILGNEIAMKAAQAGNISPWPDGSRFAKIAWQRESGPDGLVRPGKFVQVELMVKNAQQYKDTQGWGWGRWRGLDLKPYGDNAQFTTECTGCHQPMGRNDYVYSLPVSAAKSKGDDVLNHAAAALPASLPYQPLVWNPITMYVDPKSKTTATLFGNEAAIQAAQTRPSAASNIAYPSGAVLALVTWAQTEDPHWFGGRIPDAPRSVEFVQISSTPQHQSYRRFAGAALAEDSTDTNNAAERTVFMLSLTRPQLP